LLQLFRDFTIMIWQQHDSTIYKFHKYILLDLALSLPIKAACLQMSQNIFQENQTRQKRF
jgi:hypothetical protein